MSNELYFRLSVLMKDDDRVIELIYHLGMEGFGIYISLLMELRKRSGYRCALRTLNYLAEQWKVAPDVVQEVVCNYGLFGFDTSETEAERLFFSTELCESMTALENWRTAKRKKKQGAADSSNPSTAVFEPGESVQTPLEAGNRVFVNSNGVTVKRARDGRFTVKNKDAAINRLNSINRLNTSTTTEKEEEKESVQLAPGIETGAEAATRTNVSPAGSGETEVPGLCETVVLTRPRNTENHLSADGLKPWTTYLDEAFADRTWVEIQAMQSGCGLSFVEHLEAIKELFRTHVLAQGAERNLNGSADVRSYFSNFNRPGKITHRRLLELLRRTCNSNEENNAYRHEQRDPKSGQRSYCGRYIPADAPPRPSENAVWSDQLRQWG